MKKRSFLSTTLGAALGAAALPVMAASPKPPRGAPGPIVLTVHGAIGKGNRGPLDPGVDVLMEKQGSKFSSAHAFNFEDVSALPQHSFIQTLDTDAKKHRFTGALLSEVVLASGAKPKDSSKVSLRAVDGYAALLTWADVNKYRYILATHMDDKPLTLGGLGPLFAVYEADRFPEKAKLPVADRLAGCPWGMYVINVIA